MPPDGPVVSGSYRARITTALLPAKASALFCTMRTSAGRASLGTGSRPHSGSVRRWLIVGGMNPSVMARAQAAEARALAAPMVWPSIALMDTVGGGSANTWRMAPASVTSLAFVPVPCAEMKSMSSGLTPALRWASSMQAARLSRSGATGWWASQFRP